MPTLQVSLSSGEISILEAEANDQVDAIVEKMQKLGKEIDWSKIQRVVASTVAAQIIRKALPALENKIVAAKLKREEEKK